MPSSPPPNVPCLASRYVSKRYVTWEWWRFTRLNLFSYVLIEGLSWIKCSWGFVDPRHSYMSRRCNSAHYCWRDYSRQPDLHSKYRAQQPSSLITRYTKQQQSAIDRWWFKNFIQNTSRTQDSLYNPDPDSRGICRKGWESWELIVSSTRPTRQFIAAQWERRQKDILHQQDQAAWPNG